MRERHEFACVIIVDRTFSSYAGYLYIRCWMEQKKGNRKKKVRMKKNDVRVAKVEEARYVMPTDMNGTKSEEDARFWYNRFFRSSL